MVSAEKGVDAHHLELAIKKLVPDLEKSRRIGSLSSLKLCSSAHTGTRLDEFVLMIDGFMQKPPMFGDDLSAAFSQNDAALDRMHPMYGLVTPTGTIQNKEQRVAPIRSGALKYDYAKYDEINVRIYGEMAIVTAHVTVKSQLKGAPLNGQFRSTLTLLKVKGNWELVASQASAIN